MTTYDFEKDPMAYCAFDIGADRVLDAKVKAELAERWASATYHYRWVSFWCPVEAQEFYEYSGIIPEVRPKRLYRKMPIKMEDGSFSPLCEYDPDFAPYRPMRVRHAPSLDDVMDELK